jgi:hypothetical protein
MNRHILQTTPAVYAGKSLSYELRNKTAAPRAALAAGYDDLHIIGPTRKQLAALFKVVPNTLAVASTLPPLERDRVLRGQRPLVEKQDRVKAACRVIDTDDDVVRVLFEIGPECVYRALDKITSPMLDAAE